MPHLSLARSAMTGAGAASRRPGAQVTRDAAGAPGVRFCMWAPVAAAVELVPEDGGAVLPLARGADDVFARFVPGWTAGMRYRFRLTRPDRSTLLLPDPASAYQPEGVHGPSEVVDLGAYPWRDAGWQGTASRDHVAYELHVGTFTPEGTLAAAQEKLPYLRDLGVTDIELMPLHAFVGERGWGYDPAALFALHAAYGTPQDLCAFVDGAHALGLGVILDVVYNHLGPDGAWVAATGPFLDPAHQTGWGSAVNLSGVGSRGVRDFLIANALYWLKTYHIDGLRLDAVCAMVDDSPRPFLAELSDAVAQLPGWRRFLIGEDATNDSRYVRPVAQGGCGLDGMWADCISFILQCLVTGEAHEKHQGYAPATTAKLAQAINDGWYYTGEPVIQRMNRQMTGSPPGDVRQAQVWIALQHHDHVGNRPYGDRLATRIDRSLYHAASALILFLPESLIIFQGEEWGAQTPFLFFCDQRDPGIAAQVVSGRLLKAAGWSGIDLAQVPDPQAEATFLRAKLDWQELADPRHAGTLALYRDCLARRRSLSGPAVAVGQGGGITVTRGRSTLLVSLGDGRETLPRPPGTLQWSSAAPQYGADAAQPPISEDTTVTFFGPGALWFS